MGAIGEGMNADTIVLGRRTRDKIPQHLTEHRLRPIGQVAVDETWSALRFRPLKPGEAPFRGGKR